MTAIAWDGVTLAGDRRVTIGSAIVGQVQKIHRAANGDLLGYSGNTMVGTMLVRWYNDGAEPGKFPAEARESEKENSTDLLVITRDRRILYFYEYPVPSHDLGPHYAIGSGGNEARAAMLCGKTAREAILIASRLDSSVGPDVDTLVHDDA